MTRGTAFPRCLFTCKRILLLLCLSFMSCSHAFFSVLPVTRKESLTRARIPRSAAAAHEEEIAFWIAAFSSSHIGMSATRGRIIGWLGESADTSGLVGNQEWKLPDFWPGDSVGQNQIFSDSETTGRQLYRALYTAISFVTLGNALYFYLESDPIAIPSESSDYCFAVAVASFAAAGASLANASPLGLMPGFETSQSGSVTRNDASKFTARGLTRITRHPLILPVVPWGIANAMILGGRPADWLFFGGLAVYAICGCAAQDLRVSRQEGSVGTTFDDFDELQNFYQSTSFVPFGAIASGKQDLWTTLREVPWWAAGIGWFVGNWLEARFIELVSVV